MSVSVKYVPFSIFLMAKAMKEQKSDRYSSKGFNVLGISTIFTSQPLLEKTIKERGIQIKVTENVVECFDNQAHYVFHRKQLTDNFVMQLKGNLTKAEVEDWLAGLEEEYMENVQTQTYETLLSKLEKSEEMEIECEEVLEDNSILLTINVNA